MKAACSSSSISSSSISKSSSSQDFVNTDQTPDVSHVVSWKSRGQTEDTSQPQDNSDTTALASQTVIHTDSIYTSTAISRAGERTLLSVTSSSGNSTSSAFTDDSKSHQPPSTGVIPARSTETEDYTHPSPRSDSRDTTDQHLTQPFKGMFSETGTPSLTEPPNATRHQQTSASEESSESTPPLTVSELSTDQSDMSVSSPPPVTSPSRAPTDTSGTDLESDSYVMTSTESSPADHSPSTQNQEGTERHSMDLGLTTAPPTVSINTSEMDGSLTGPSTVVTETFRSTTPVPVTERPQVTEVDTFKASASSSSSSSTTTTTTTTTPLSATSSSSFSSTANGSAPELHTEATTSSTTASTPALQTSAVHPTQPVSPIQTVGPSTGADSTYPTTLQVETGTVGATTSHSQQIITTSTHSTPTRSTEAQRRTTRKQTTTGLLVTTSPTVTLPTKTPPPARNLCVSNPCLNGGMCVSYKRHQYTCHCHQAWTGPTCNQDVNECQRDPCPLGSRCVNTRGSFSCECPLGFDLEDGRLCTRAKTFLGTFSVNRQPQDPVIFKSVTMHEIQREIIQLLNASLSVLRGYRRSTLNKKEEDGVRITAVNMFSISTDVTSTEVFNSIQMSLSNCSSSTTHCHVVLHHQLTYHVESLCVAQKTQCDAERSTCTDSGGTAYCQCFQGYYKHNPDDLSCLECGDGYKLVNGTCVPCMFGFGGFNCGNFYKLIAVVVSPAGGALLLILIIALIVTCCKKDKNDINKIIFKSGDLQMSPYADFPKNNRISMEWGRETIEMQENGSTKNLLQMTDIYYSPALRNSDLERNGLYPFPGLPGSRHSCIYPAQWNPSFVSDDSRRRDYF
uniref:protein HEG n=1 Tax=Solea senegalensis TaxID=28829 RepID=UPI001CD88F84|nr:protein HEG [Solea senegalensis]